MSGRVETFEHGARVVALARRWIGTPYRHQASLKGVGCDCLGLVRGVFAEITGKAAEAPPPYQPDWAERCGVDRLMEAARAIAASRCRSPKCGPATSCCFAGVRALRRNMRAFSQARITSSMPMSLPA